MATRTLTFERLTSLLRPQSTFWNELSLDERQSSVNQAVHRSLGDKTAWDAAGLVSQYWIDEICPVVEEYRRTHSRYILNGEDWTGPVNCFMIGLTWMTSIPTVVITSLDKGIYGRLGSLLRKDERFRRSGFSILGQRGCLRLKMRRSYDSFKPWDPNADGLQHCYGETIVIPYSWTVRAYAGAVHQRDLFELQHQATTATMGGVIEIGEHRFGLTVAHPFVDPKRKVPAESITIALPEPSVNLRSTPSEQGSLGSLEIEEIFDSDTLDTYENDGEPIGLANQWDLLAVPIDEDLTARPIFHDSVWDLPRETMSKSAISLLRDYADMQIGTFPGSSIAVTTKHLVGEPRKYADLGLDWALIDLPDEVRFDWSNTLVTSGNVIRTSNVAKGPPVGDVLIVCKASQYPQATCSGTMALISIPGSGRLQKAYTLKRSQFSAEREIKSTPGESGSLVINQTTGDAYGVVVAESLDLELTYMIPLDLIFEDIASKWSGDLVRFPRTQQEEDLIGRSREDELFRGIKKLPSDRWVDRVPASRAAARQEPEYSEVSTWPTTSGRSTALGLRALSTSTDHSRIGSGDNTSYTSSKGRPPIWRSASSSPKIRVSYTMFTDARFALAYTSNRISCYDCELRSWSEGRSFNRISMAAGSFGRYAVISEGKPADTLSVIRRDDAHEYEEWASRLLPEQPLSLAISRQGHKIAVGFAGSIRVYDGAIGTFEPLPAPVPSEERLPLIIDSQCISFSVDATHLVVATRETRDGNIYTVVYDLQPPSRHFRQMCTIRIPSRFPRDFHLSSIVYDQSTSTVCIFSSAAQGHTYFINSISKTATAVINRVLCPSLGDSIQCAAILPGTPPRIALVDDNNNFFILTFSSDENRWMPQSVPVKLDKGRKGVNKFDEKISIAATDDGTARIFWMQSGQGRLLSIESGHEGPFEPETTPTIPF